MRRRVRLRCAASAPPLRRLCASLAATSCVLRRGVVLRPVLVLLRVGAAAPLVDSAAAWLLPSCLAAGCSTRASRASAPSASSSSMR
eukprot:6853414-Prymnesium_polylepis.1